MTKTILGIIEQEELKMQPRVNSRSRSTDAPDLRYPHQFTIRSRLPSLGETELQKIVNGHGDWMFYGNVSDSQNLGP